MASPTHDFAMYCCELLSGVGPCTAKRMFGGYGISTSGLTFALVADLGGGETLWLKADEASRAQFEAAGCEKFSYETSRNGKRALHSLNYYSAPADTMESPQLMLPWARVSFGSALKVQAEKSVRAREATKIRAKPVSRDSLAATAAPARPRARRPTAPTTSPSARRKSSKG